MVRTKPILASPCAAVERFTSSHLPPVSWCPVSVHGEAAEDPRRRPQDLGDSRFDVGAVEAAEANKVIQ